MTGMRVCVSLIACTLAAAGQQPAAKPFVPSDELNATLPRWLRFSGEYRARVEGFTSGGFRNDNDDLYLLNRFRIQMRVQPVSWMKLHFQGQDARVFGKNQKPAAPPFQDTMDLRLAFLELGDVEKARFSLRAGRQELVFGEQRLIGHVGWLNTARSFDAIRATLRHGGYRLDAFASSVVNARDGEFNRHTDGNNFHGLYGGIEKLIPNTVIEPYALWRLAPTMITETGTRGRLDFKTYGVRMAGKLPAAFDYGIEIARQAGGLGSDSIRAWAGHWRTGYTAADLPCKPRLVAEYNYATGDKNPRDGRRGTFDILYPTPHDKYGLADQVGWKNIHHVRLGPEFKPRPKWLLSANYHSWWLATTADALYSAGGVAVARLAPGAGSDRHVGQELDAQAVYTWNKQVQIAGGFARIFPGAFLKATTPGRSFNFPYVMIGYAF
jgi:hypothetical protein